MESVALEGYSILGILDRAEDAGRSAGVVINKKYWLESWVYYTCSDRDRTCIVKSRDGLVLMLSYFADRPIVRVYDERKSLECD